MSKEGSQAWMPAWVSAQCSFQWFIWFLNYCVIINVQEYTEKDNLNLIVRYCFNSPNLLYASMIVVILISFKISLCWKSEVILMYNWFPSVGSLPQLNIFQKEAAGFRHLFLLLRFQPPISNHTVTVGNTQAKY